MSRTSLEVKAKRKPKFSARAYNRCPLCSRAGKSIAGRGSVRAARRTPRLWEVAASGR